MEDYKFKEKDMIKQMEKIHENFEHIKQQQNSEIVSLRDQLELKKKDVGRLEKYLFEERRSNKILMSETQSMHRRSVSRLSTSSDINAHEYVQNFLRLETENRSLKIENNFLTEELVFVKNRAEREQGMVFASVLGFVVNQRALD